MLVHFKFRPRTRLVVSVNVLVFEEFFVRFQLCIGVDSCEVKFLDEEVLNVEAGAWVGSHEVVGNQAEQKDKFVEQKARFSLHGFTGGLGWIHILVVHLNQRISFQVLVFLRSYRRNHLLDKCVEVFYVQHGRNQGVGAGQFEEGAHCHDLVFVFNVAPGYNFLGAVIEVLVNVLREQKFELIVVKEVDADGLF